MGRSPAVLAESASAWTASPPFEVLSRTMRRAATSPNALKETVATGECPAISATSLCHLTHRIRDGHWCLWDSLPISAFAAQRDMLRGLPVPHHRSLCATHGDLAGTGIFRPCPVRARASRTGKACSALPEWFGGWLTLPAGSKRPVRRAPRTALPAMRPLRAIPDLRSHGSRHAHAPRTDTAAPPVADVRLPVAHALPPVRPAPAQDPGQPEGSGRRQGREWAGCRS